MENIFLKRILIFWILILLGGASVITSVNSMNEDIRESNISKTDCDWIVDDEGDGDFISIQDAVIQANSGDIICVYSGNYTGFRILSKDNLQIIGVNNEYENGTDDYCPRIDGRELGNVIEVDNSQYVKIIGFEIFNSSKGLYDAGIYYLNSNNGEISNNLVRDNYYGLFMQDSNYMEISLNVVINNDRSGIALHQSNDARVWYNQLSNNGKNGIWLAEVWQCQIHDNNLTRNGNYGVFIYEYRWSFNPALNHITHNNIAENVGGDAHQVRSFNFWRYNWWGKPYNIRIILNSIPPIIDLVPSKVEYTIPWGPC